MEFFSALLAECAEFDHIPTPYHIKNVWISYLLFVDDVMLFACASLPVAGNIRNFLEDFKKHSGLSINFNKSSVFFSNFDEDTRSGIAAVLNIQQRELPMRDLGIPLFSSQLHMADCTPIIEKLCNKLAGWTARTLSFAGRLELIRSTLSTLPLYWASNFLLPKACINLLEKHTRNFLWGRFDNAKGTNTVAWKVVCTPRDKGGFGLEINLEYSWSGSPEASMVYCSQEELHLEQLGSGKICQREMFLDPQDAF